MPSKQEIRSEETRRAILSAASQQFASRGFEPVTMREIAKIAGCSHTTIYIYFKDKEDLLYRLSMGPLAALQQRMEVILADNERAPSTRLKSITAEFIEFCLLNRSMYDIFFMTKATRVDDGAPELEINKVRNHMFGLLVHAIAANLGLNFEASLTLAYARIFFFTLHGILSTYVNSEEPLDVLKERLAPTFDLAVDVLIAGFNETLKSGCWDE